MSVLITAISWARESNVWDKNEYTLDAQMEANAANAARDGLTIAHTFRERYSGVDLWIMPELTRLRSLIQSTPGRKIVYVYAQDRLVRGEEGEDIFWLLVEFRRYQAEVRFHLNPVDMSSIAGKIQMLIAGNEASNEIQKIYDRTWTRGRLRRMKEGKIPMLQQAEAGKTKQIQNLAKRLRTASALIASHIESEMATVETERRAIELQILRLQQEFANKKTQEQQTKSLAAIAAEIADKLDLLEAPMRREVLEALPFIYTLRGEVRIRPAVECPTAAI